MTEPDLSLFCSYEKLITIANRWIELGWQKGDVDALDILHTPDFLDRDPSGRLSDLVSFKQGILDLYAAFPDFYTEIENLVVDESSQQVAIKWKAIGTHRGEFLGFKPTGKNIQFSGIEIIRLEKGLIIERWGEWDGIDLLHQLEKGNYTNAA